MRTVKRLERAYDKVRRLEQKVDPRVAVKMRATFDSETIQIIDNHQRASGWNRQQRRKFKREMARG